MSGIVFTYNFVLKKSETKKYELPDLKSSCLLLKSFEIITEQKSLDIKLVGKDTILSYGEAVFHQLNKFDLTDKMAQIVDSDKITVVVKNLCTLKDVVNVNLTMNFNYQKITDGYIIYNNIYTNLNQEGLQNILNDISHAGKHVTKFIWTSPNKLSAIELTPQFESTPQWLVPIKELCNTHNQVIMDLTDPKYDPDLVNQLCYYNLSIPDNVEKICVIVYGFIH